MLINSQNGQSSVQSIYIAPVVNVPVNTPEPTPEPVVEQVPVPAPEVVVVENPPVIEPAPTQ